MFLCFIFLISFSQYDFIFFFFNDTATTEIYTLSLHDALPISALRVLLVFTYRPGYANPFGERSYFTRIVPAALSAEDSARMAAAVLATDELPAELRALV